VREYQVLSNADKFLGEVSHVAQPSLAAQVLANNLILHRHDNVAKLLIEAVQAGNGFQLVQRKLRELMEQCRVYYLFHNKKRQILGLAEFQYREFFTSLVPAYAEIGVDGAQECQAWTKADESATKALKRLRQYYSDETTIRTVGLTI
jgi:hypothetical protein